MASLTLDAISKIYGAGSRQPIKAVDRVSLDVRDGEIVGLLGSSGCGKTSTLRMIAGFESVTEGRILIEGRPIHDLPPAKRRVAMAFEGYALYPPLKVRENIGFALLREKRPHGEVDKRVREVAALLEIEDILDRYPSTISAGQQQRTSLARALIRMAPVSLLDEPMSQLEPQLRAILRARIKDYLIAHKMTTVFVTHDQTEAIALADRIAVMEKGVLQQFAPPFELKEHPSNLFVASFIGEPPMNIMDAATVDAGSATLEIRNPAGQASFRISLAGAETQNQLQSNQRYKLGIRAHRIVVGQPVNGGGSPRPVGKVVSNQWLGDQTHLGIDVGGCFLIAVADGPVTVRVGDEVPIELPVAALHLFAA
jgi:multiple sugar transport system ATP-binding protein